MATPRRATAKRAEPKPQASKPKRDGKPFISEGLRQEVERLGEAVDPLTGKTVTKADLA